VRGPVTLLLLLLAAAGAVAQDDDSGIQETTLEPITLERERERETIAVVLHYWVAREGVDESGGDGAPPAKRVVDVQVTAPPAVRAVRVTHAASPAEVGARFEEGTRLTFGDDDSARELRIELVLAKTGGDGDLVLTVTPQDPHAVPRARRIVVPLRFGDAPAAVETSAAREDEGIEMWITISKKPKASADKRAGFMRFGRVVHGEPRPATPEFAHAFTSATPMLRLNWDEPSPQSWVVAVATMRGGVPAVDEKIVDHNGAGTSRMHFPGFRNEGQFLVRLPSPESTGTFAIEGELRAYTDGKNWESQTPLARRPFSASLTYGPSPHRKAVVARRLTFGRSKGSLYCYVRLEHVQTGKRPMRMTVGGRSVWTLKTTGQLVGLQDVPRAGTVTLEDFGETVTLPFELTDLRVQGTRDPIDAAGLAEVEGDLGRERAQGAEGLPRIPGLLERRAELLAQEMWFDPSPWVQAVEAAVAAHETHIAALASPAYVDEHGRKMRDEDRRKRLDRRLEDFSDYLADSAQFAGRVQRLDTMKRWLVHAGRVAEQRGYEAKTWYSLLRALKQLPTNVFETTGDLARARAEWDEYRKWARRDPEYKDEPFPLVPDEAFR